MADVFALQDEAGMAAVVENGALHRWAWGLHRHPAVLQGCPHPWAQQHWEFGREGEEDIIKKLQKAFFGEDKVIYIYTVYTVEEDVLR